VLPDLVRSHPLFPRDPRAVLTDAFVKTDREYVRAEGDDALYTGTTAVVALLTRTFETTPTATTGAGAGDDSAAAADLHTHPTTDSPTLPSASARTEPQPIVAPRAARSLPPALSSSTSSASAAPFTPVSSPASACDGAHTHTHPHAPAPPLTVRPPTPPPHPVLTIHVANAGDSRAILVRRDGTALALSNDHKVFGRVCRSLLISLCSSLALSFSPPTVERVANGWRARLFVCGVVWCGVVQPNRDDEQKRIESAGGRVIRHSEGGRSYGPFRVYTAHSLGGLAVSRAFGDSVYRVDSHSEQWLVTPNPEIVAHAVREQTDLALVLGSDGLW
jgi:serine/threonine protein phosphatase PrpC